MNQAQAAAQAAVDQLSQAFTTSGCVQALQALVRDVWVGGLDRYEPEALGDTRLALSFLASENLRERAVRRSACDEREATDDHWNLPELHVSTRSRVLTLTLGESRIVPMKVPIDHGRIPQVDRFPDWDHLSKTRRAMAKRNSAALGGFETSYLGQPMLFEDAYDPCAVRDFILLWAGDPDRPLTAGYLAVPVAGPHPFAATTRLWWDDAESAPRGARRAFDGPSYDAKGLATPVISLKPRPAAEGQA